jgi:hypothetical protein
MKMTAELRFWVRDQSVSGGYRTKNPSTTWSERWVSNGHERLTSPRFEENENEAEKKAIEEKIRVACHVPSGR